MPIFILVGEVVLLVCIKSASIMSFPARIINKTPLNLPIRMWKEIITVKGLLNFESNKHNTQAGQYLQTRRDFLYL